MTRFPSTLTACLGLLLAGCMQTETRPSEPALAGNTAVDITTPETAVVMTPPTIDVQYAAEFEQLGALPELTDDTVWTRIREGFRLEVDLEQKRLQQELDWYARHPAYLERVMRRAEPFLHYILEETENRDLPTELVLLPVVESAFQPFAYSHGRASGIWQFIPSTGKLYGLEQNWWYDGRRDIYESTQAALNYLVNLNKLFDGNWMHALAAYNSGPGNVRKAIRKNNKRGRPTDFWNLSLPKETRMYVPKLLALKHIMMNPHDFKISLLCIPDSPGFQRVDAGSQIDLALAADLAGIDIQTLYRYNPAFNQWATPPSGPHAMIMPAEAASRFEQNLQQVPVDERVSWKRHKVREGETLSHIAVKHKTTVRELRKINKISNNKHLRAGKHVLVPASRKNSTAYSLSAGQRLKTTRNIQRGSNSVRVDHVVKRGESFWEISREYGVNMRALARWNGMATRDPLREGQKLVVWTKPGTASSVNGQRDGTIQRVTHTVRNGESLSRIASRYRVTVADLHRWNSIKGKYLQPGQKIRVYVDVTRQSGST